MKRTTKYVAFDVHQATTVASVREESGRVIARSVLPLSVGNTLRAITRPLSSRTDATVVAWCTSNATYFVVRFMRAAPCWGPQVLVDSMVAAGGALSTCVRRPQSHCHD